MEKARRELLKKRKTVVLKKKIIATMIAVVVVLFGSFLFGNLLTTNAKGNTTESPVNYKYYKSIEIQQGDTLWSLAKRYMSKEETASVQKYIADVKKINTMNSDNIQAGQYLTIIYYDTQFK